MKGLVHVYTGDGKGKTTAAIGLGLRAYGRGLKVLVFQFLKGTETGEIKALKELKGNLLIYNEAKIDKFTWEMNSNEVESLKTNFNCILNYISDVVLSSKCDLLILDEIMAVISLGLIDIEDIVDFIKNKPYKLEIVLTGRNVPGKIIEIADYVSEINFIKHPYTKGVTARIGIEY